MSHSLPTRRLALSCSALALAAALAAPAQAQSFQGNATVVFGSANVVQGSTTTNVNVSTPSAVIDWTPTDTAISAGTPINWQPAGTQANFIGQGADYVVLNRIVPNDTSRPITFNGTVVSRYLQGQIGFAGGTVFFYSPGGIVLGPTAVFDVGHLGLTTAPPIVDANGGWYTNNTVQFGQAASASSIRIQQGAQINASVQGGYVAAFAPLVDHDGAIVTNGQAALVAGEAGTINFSPDGLFDIQVTVGTGNASFPIDVTGDITGGASTGFGDNRRIYLVAVPKNQLLTMSIQRGASLGFDIAGAANVQGNAVVLTAGYNVTDGLAETARAGGGGTGTITINDSNVNLSGTGIDVTSALSAKASETVSLNVFRQTRFASDVSLVGVVQAQGSVSSLLNDSIGSLTVGGDFTLSADRQNALAGATSDAGTAVLTATVGSTATFARNVNLSARAFADSNLDGVATGGTTQIQISQSGTINVGGNLVLDSSAVTSANATALAARGGSSQIFLFPNNANQQNNAGNNTLVTTGVTRIVANGIAGANNGNAGTGAVGTGGSSSLIVRGGSSATIGQLNVSADGVGGLDAGAGGGAGNGGSASVTVSDANSRMTVQSTNTIGVANLGERDMVSAEGRGGVTALTNGVGGLGRGGSASISVTAGGRLDLPTTGTNFILARAYGGNASGNNSTGGEARSGAVSISVNAGILTGEGLVPSSFSQGGGDLALLPTVVVNGGNAFGGTRNIAITNGSVFTGSITGGGPSGVGGSGSALGRGGNGSGGTATTSIDASTVNITAGRNLLTFSQNTGGGGAIGGNSSGGAATVDVRNGAVVNLGNGASFGAVANGLANGINPGEIVTQTGGNAAAGNATLLVNAARISGAGTVEVSAGGFANSGPVTGGTGTGGNARLEVTSGTISVATLNVAADGEGGEYVPQADPVSGARGGAGTGGQATVILRGAALTVTNAIDIGARGEGGAIGALGSGGQTGGNGVGGTVILQAASGTNTITTPALFVDGSGTGGTLFDGSGTGGNGTGGNARIDALSGASLAITAATEITADGSGSSAQNGGTGGVGTGGRAYSFANGGSITFNGEVDISTDAEGGDGTVGGAATGGIAYLQSFTDGTTVVTGDVRVSSDALAGLWLGDVTIGGAATGGSAQILASNGNARLTLDGSADISAIANGGVGARDAQGNGGPGGTGTGGLAEIGGSVGTGNVLTVTGTVDVDASATGGTGYSVSGGNAVAGRAFVSAGDGTSVRIDSDVIVEASAYGGVLDTFNGLAAAPGTSGGSATSGRALVQTFNTGGSITLGRNLLILSSAGGGSAFNAAGDGGDATAGFAQIFARNGMVSILGTVSGEVNISGGSGDTGGDAIALANDTAEAGIFAQNAQVTVGGQTVFSASATGGDGRDGGAGGSALAGVAYVDANTNVAGGTSAISLADLFLSSSASGGTGGAGVGRAGGAGGSATASSTQAFGTSGNGRLTVSGTTNLFSIATGGTGGASDSATGGAGGAATSGYIQFGVRSGDGVGPDNAGSATFTDVTALSAAVGGEGGASSSGTGGAGGNAAALGGVLLVRGAPVSAASVTVTGTGIGGDGGGGANTGAGGYGAGGPVALAASNRFQRAERGSADIGALNLVSVGQGGAGSTPGAAYYAGDGGVSLIQSDVTLGSLSYANAGVLAPPPAVIAAVAPIELTLSASTLTVDSLSMNTPGEFLLDLDNARIDANSFAIGAGTFIFPAVAPANPGTITVRDDLTLIATNPGGSVRTYAGFASAGSLFYSAGDSVVLGNIDTDGVFEASAATGTVTVGNIDASAANLSAQGNVVAGNVRVGGLFDAESNAGSVAVGTIDAQAVRLRGNTDVTARRITATNIIAQAGGLASVLGPWSAPSLQIVAGDLAIPDGGALSAGANGSVFLTTTNSAGGFVGDGLAGQTGYRLSAAEVARISGNSIFLGVLDGANGVDLTLGTFALNGGQLPGSDGYFEFATGLGEGQQSGRIRVDGAVTGNGLGATQYLSFTTGSFELNAESGSIALAGNGVGGLGGIVEIDAANIHVASPAILARLRENPRYEGLADELNAPAAVQRPNGVLRALGFELFPSDTLYIQNTGTAINPAGFYATPDASDIEPPGFENSQAPDVDAIINGRFATPAGDVSGRDVFTLVAEDPEASFEGFSEASQINGCAFNAEACAASLGEDSPELAVLQSEFELLSGQRLEEDPFDLDEASQDEEEAAEQAARAPIEPPVVLIDTSPLNPPVDIADPVSGSGNPASLTLGPAASETGDDQ